MIRTFLGGLVVTGLLLVGLAAQQPVQLKPNLKEISSRGLSGRRAPSFALPDGALKQYDILDYRGRWLLLEFLKTDMQQCKDLVKQLDQMKPRLGAKVAMLAVVVPPDNTSTVSRFLIDTKTTTPVVFDSGQTAMWYFKATPQHSQFDTPHVFAINPAGMLVKDWNQSELEAKGFAAQLDALVGLAAAPKK